MAEKALHRLEEELNCSICLDTYTDPKQLQCNHIYCRRCLVKLVIRDEQGELVIACPACRQPTPIPARGVSGLPAAFHINHILDLTDSMKELYLSGNLIPAKSHDDLSTCDVARCSQHVEEELKLYCVPCEKLICLKCALRGNMHSEHDYQELDVALKKYKEEIASSLDPMERQLATVDNALVQLDTRCEEITDQQAAILNDIHHSFQCLHDILSSRSKEIIGQLDQITQEKLNSLAAQRREMETAQTHLIASITAMKNAIASEDPREALINRVKEPKENCELHPVLAGGDISPCAVADMAFVASPGVTTACQDYGLVLASSLPYPPKCRATGKGLEVAVVGEKTTASLQSINFTSKPCELPEKSLECELVSRITGTRLHSQDFDIRRRHSQHFISYQPKVKGRHQLHIRVDGQEIKGSPFNVVAKCPVEKLGSTILTIESLDAPRGETINSKSGEVIITEYSGHRVSIFSCNGEKLKSFGSHGSGQGQFRYPRGVALDADGNILVADSGNHRIQKFSPEGSFIAAVGTGGSGPLQFKWPDGIAFNSGNGKIYISDDNHRIQILNGDLTFFRCFGKEGSSRGQFNYPSGIGCDDMGQVYIADSNNHRVRVVGAG